MQRFPLYVCSMVMVILSATSVGAQEEGLRDIRGPLTYPIDSIWIILLWVIIASGILVVARLLWRLYQRRRNYVPPAPPVPPWDVALRLLELLREKKYIEYSKFQDYYSELSDILRRYMEDYFHVRAPEMTTEEFLISIKSNDQVTEEHKAILSRFMQQADVVKFAKVSPTNEEAEQSWELARRFIMQSYDDEEGKA